MDLTPKQQRFCEEYLVDLNGTQAAIRAGYSEKTAAVIARENLIKPYIQEYIQKKQTEVSNKLNLTHEWVLNRLKEISDRCMQAIPVMEWVDGEQVNTGDYKFDSSGANKATELIGRHLGMFPNKVDVTSKGESVNPKRPAFRLPDGTMLEI